MGLETTGPIVLEKNKQPKKQCECQWQRLDSMKSSGELRHLSSLVSREALARTSTFWKLPFSFGNSTKWK